MFVIGIIFNWLLVSGINETKPCPTYHYFTLLNHGALVPHEARNDKST